MTRIRRILRHAGPAMGFVGWPEALRATAGMLIGMLALLLLFSLHPADTAWGLFIVAPFGASAVLLFALPNSPLAQPWSAVVGNSISALVGVALIMTGAPPWLQVMLAAPLAVLAMLLCRALHPPGGAVALATVLAPEVAAQLGLLYPLVPVALGTLALVPVAALVAHFSGRRYPFRQPPAPAAAGPTDPPPLERLAVSREELAHLLQDFNQSANIGVEDLARLIAAAELLAARHQSRTTTCADIMSRDLVTVQPETPLSEVAALFRRHGFTALPVVDAAGSYRGVIFQIHLIRRGDEEAQHNGTRFVATLSRMLGAGGARVIRAHEVMDPHVPHLTPETEIHHLMPILAGGVNDAVPILAAGRLVGIVTQTDLIAALAQLRD
ncbi:CBS domain-containing protein [Xinfangfangia sp. D13-10-4-6]|uniref:HPP family protein n=1 Tax=Pseudogemmobacter hezensis TaxID=2737662 RepID=UPI001552739D|nr:HPP family protein [Pseudogemmobacter hezensis]NPD16553.1 CBS domain-containing protein [Pseudogemmobacter hezensis]